MQVNFFDTNTQATRTENIVKKKKVVKKRVMKP